MDINKELNLKYIKEFSKINVASICRDLKVDKPNVYKGTASADNIRKVREEIEKRIDELNKI